MSASSARSIIASFSGVTSEWYGMRDDRQADAGSSHVGSPARRDSSLILGLREVGLVERAAHAQLPGGLAPRPVIAAVVRIGAVEDGRDAPLAREPGQLREQLLLAVVAAVRLVGAILGVLHLAGDDELVVEGEVAGQALGDGAVPGRVAGAVGGDALRRAPSTEVATQARYALSVPPLYATMTEPSSASAWRRRASFSISRASSVRRHPGAAAVLTRRRPLLTLFLVVVDLLLLVVIVGGGLELDGTGGR